MRNQVTVRYSEDGKCILDCHQEELIASLEIENKPQLRAIASVLLPGRTLAVIQVNSNLNLNKVVKSMRLNPMFLYLKSILIYTLCLCYIMLIPIQQRVYPWYL